MKGRTIAELISWCLYLNVYLGIVDGAILPTETRLPSSTRPHWLEPTIYSSEEDGLTRAASDGVGGDNLNMLSVAVKILSDKSESNTKVCALHCCQRLLICLLPSADCIRGNTFVFLGKLELGILWINVVLCIVLWYRSSLWLWG